MAELSREAVMAFLLALTTALSVVTASQGYPEALSLLAGEGPYSISETCNQHLQLYQNSTGTELWAMQMLDSWTKFPSGLIYGVPMDLGNYDECVSQKDIPSQAGAFSGKYCLMTVFPVPDSPDQAKRMVRMVHERFPSIGHAGGVMPRSMPSSASMAITGAVCLPSSCSEMDFMTYLNVNFSQTLEILPIPKMSFYTEDKYCNVGTYDAFRPIDWGAVSFLIIFALFAVISTAYDLLTEKSDSRKELLLAFSWYSNGKKLFSTRKSTQDISCLHGIRFLSMVWVVICHGYSSVSSIPSTNLAAFSKQLVENWGYIFLQGGTLSVDTFFLLSGILVAYVFLNSVHRGARFNIVIFYLHRYIRLTPALAVIIFMYVSLTKYTGAGPLWKLYSTSSCNDHWWKHLLYVNNYFDLDNPCVGQAWYLAADMQLYWLSPLVLIPLWKKPKVGKALLGLFTFAGLAISFGICYNFEIITIIKAATLGGTEAAQNYYNYYYYYTHTRFTPWLLGIAFGYTLHEIKKQPSGRITLSVVQCFALWCFAAFFMLVALCGTFPLDQIDHEFNVTEFTFFNTFHRSVWALGVGLMILVCSMGYGGPVNTFLSWLFFLPLSRLTYGIYLIHITMESVITMPMRTLHYNNDMTLICDSIANLVLSAVFATVFCLLFESPFIVLEKVILGFFGVGRSSNKTKPPMDNVTSPTGKEQDLEAAPVEDKRHEDVPLHNEAAKEADIVEYGTAEYDKRDSPRNVQAAADFSSTANLLPH